MPTFVTKPLEIDAFHWEGDIDELIKWAKEGLNSEEHINQSLNYAAPVHANAADRLLIRTAHGDWLPVFDDHWVIREPRTPNRFYPCRPDVFADKYEKVDNAV